jgi:hypothetical protein
VKKITVIFGLFVVFFFFALIWRQVGDQVTSRAAYSTEKSHYYQQCKEMVLRLDEMYKSDKGLPLDLEELARRPQVSGTVLWSNDKLETNFILRLPEAVQLLNAGVKNVPVVFSVPRAFGPEKYCVVGFLAPAKTEQYGISERAELQKAANFVGLTNLSLDRVGEGL